ncbi:MAG TPA: hemerythrin domain-containing protein [Kofleriaceae bacterium]
MTRSVDALELLTSQHDELAAIISRLESVAPDRRALVIGELADKLCAHLAAEQELLYPSVAVVTHALDTREPSAEDETVKAALADLLGTTLDAADLRSRIEALHALIESHSRWQDTLFVELAETLPDEMLGELGAQLLELSESARSVML